MSSEAASPAKGASAHGPDCTCTRCKGFGPENTAAMRHGARSTVQIQGRAREVADELIAVMVREDLWRPSFEAMVLTAATVLVRVERAAAALAAVEAGLDEGDARPLAGYFGKRGSETGDAQEAMARLRSDMRQWVNTARTILNDLGLSPRSLAAISRDTGIGKQTRATAALRALDAHLEENYRQELEP